jgi:deoxycytidylate deaminase
VLVDAITTVHMVDSGDGRKSGDQPGPRATQQGAATPGQGATAQGAVLATGNVVEPQTDPTGHHVGHLPSPPFELEPEEIPAPEGADVRAPDILVTRTWRRRDLSTLGRAATELLAAIDELSSASRDHEIDAKLDGDGARSGRIDLALRTLRDLALANTNPGNYMGEVEQAAADDETCSAAGTSGGSMAEPLTERELDLLRRFDGPPPLAVVAISCAVHPLALRAVREIKERRKAPLLVRIRELEVERDRAVESAAAAKRSEPEANSAMRNRMRGKPALDADVFPAGNDHIFWALNSAGRSPCRSKRGVVLFDPQTSEVRGAGYNGPPAGQPCPGRETCAGTCGQRCVHAEMRALRAAMWNLRPRDKLELVLELVHVERALDGGISACDGPNCWQCSREILDVGFVGGVWLYLGFSRCFACRRFEDSSPSESERYKRCPECGMDLTPTGSWRRYTAEEFHRETLKNCGMVP